jgi:IS1 family transposase
MSTDTQIQEPLTAEEVQALVTQEKAAYNVLCISIGRKKRGLRINPFFGLRRRSGNFLGDDKVVIIVRLLVEGMSIRSISRIVGASRNTISRIIQTFGVRCKDFLEAKVAGIPCSEVEVDEMYTYIHSRHHSKSDCSKSAHTKGSGPRWVYFGLDRRTRLILAHRVGYRTTDDAIEFMNLLRAATSGGLTVYTDGFQPYPTAVYAAFIYDGDKQRIPDENDAPSVIVRNDGRIADLHGFEALDNTRAATNKIERFNLTVRNSLKRMNRATLGFSKSQKALENTMAIFLCYYNFCREHSALGGLSPAHFAGLIDEKWSVAHMLRGVSMPAYEAIRKLEQQKAAGRASVAQQKRLNRLLRDKDFAEKREEVLRRLDNGESMLNISIAMGISRQRVHQLVGPTGVISIKKEAVA